MPRRIAFLLALALLGLTLGAVVLRSPSPAAPTPLGAFDEPEGDGGGADALRRPETVRSAVEFVWSVRVVDEAGGPVEGVRIDIGRREATQTAVSDRDGVAGFRRRFDGDSRVVVVDDPAFRLLSPDGLRSEDADGATIVVRRCTRLGGRVVFEDSGEAVPGVELSVTGRPGARAQTDADGRFSVYADVAPGARAELAIVDPGPCIGLARPSGPWWGRGDVVIRLPRARRVVVEAIAADTGEPLADFTVRLRPVDLRTPDAGAVAGRGTAGRALVSGAWPGTNDLQVIPADPGYAPSEVVTFALREREPPPIRIAVAARRAVTVEVVDTVGRPVADASVRWVDPRGRGRIRGPTALEGELPMRPKWRWRSAARQIAAGTSDAAGRVRLFVDSDAEGQNVVVEPPVGDPVFARVAAVAALDGLLVVRVAALSTVRALLSPPVPSGWHPHAELRLRGSKSSARRTAVRADGSAVFGDVPTGSYELVLMGSGLPRPRPRELVDVTWLRNLVVAGGRDEEVGIDASSLAPAGIRGTVRGAAGADELAVELWDDDERLASAGVAADGAFAFGPLWARNGVRLRLRFGAGHGAVRRWDPAGPFDLAWNTGCSRDVVAGSAALEVRLVDARGTPVPERTGLWARRGRDGAAELGRADGQGTVRLTNLPAGRYWLTASAPPRGPRQELGTVDVVEGRVERRVLALR